MFDPTIFENVKVALENHIYDLDNMTGQIEITNRKDRLEMSVMSREFALEFILHNQKEVRAEVVLRASLKDLAAEILEISGENPGCDLLIRFYRPVKNSQVECKQIQVLIQHIWNQEQEPTQTLSFDYGEEDKIYLNKIEVTFNRQINEDQMGDIPELIEHVIRTLVELNAV